MKNFFGLMPGGVYGWPKNMLHWAGSTSVSSICTALFPRHFAIVDGIVGMDGNGPIQGKPKPAGVIVAGADLVAVDATCCRIMRIDPARIHYLNVAGPAQVEAANVRQTGERIEGVQTEFELIPQFRSVRLKS